MSKSVLVFSHGFGVRKDARGMFPDIAKALPDTVPIMFNYNDRDPDDGSLIVAPLDKQADKLEQIIERAKSQFPNFPIDLICHSQGCVVAALLKPIGIRKAIFLAPPATLSIERMVKLFGGRPRSRIDFKGTSLLERSDFSFTKVPPEYWTSIQNRNIPQLFNDFAKITDLIIVHALEDEVVGKTDFSALSPDVKQVELHAKHNFDGDTKQELLNVVRKELA